jgi:hypothetical protein
MAADRYIRWADEPSYAVATTPTAYRDIVTESLRLDLRLSSIRPARRIAATRQVQRRRSVSGELAPLLGWDQIDDVLAWVCGPAVAEHISGSEWQRRYVPDAQYTPTSRTVDVARERELHRYRGVVPTSLRLSMSAGDAHLALSIGCLGADEAAAGALPSPAEAAFPAPLHIGMSDAALAVEVELSDGSTTWTQPALSIDLQLDWNRQLREPARSLVPTGVTGGAVAGARGRIRWDYDEDTQRLLDAFRGRTGCSLALAIRGTTLATGIYQQLLIELPSVTVDGQPPTLRGSGAGNIEFSADMPALYSEAIGGPFRASFAYIADPPTELVLTELLLNGGCEDALVGGEIPQWTEVIGTTWTRGTVTGTGIPTQAGEGYFRPGNGANHELAQDVDVSALALEIDTGVHQFIFTGYVRSFNQTPADTSRIVIEYRDASETVLSSFDSGGIANKTAWQLVADTRNAPVGTRTIRVRLVSKRYNGTSNDGYYDSLSLKTLVPS